MFFLALTSADGGRPNANSSPPFAAAAACRAGSCSSGSSCQWCAGCSQIWMPWCLALHSTKKKLEHDGGGTVLDVRHDNYQSHSTSTNPTTRHSIYSVVIGGFFYWTSLFCTNQASVQKCMSLKSMKKAKKAVCFAILGKSSC